MTVTKAVANQSAPANESLSPDEGKDDGKICPDTNEIKRLRKQNGISQETLAYKTGLSLKTIRNLESNPNYRCRASTLSVLADFYGIEAKAFVIRDDKKITLLTNTNDIIAANINICRSAEKIFACMGSRSRDVAYLEEVEKKLCDSPELIHYRVMAFPPFKKMFQDHLRNLIKIRNPADRSHGYKSVHIGIYEDLTKQPESSMCLNEKSVLIVLPSMFGISEYNTALYIEDEEISLRFLHTIKSIYQAGRPVETVEAIEELGLVENG